MLAAEPNAFALPGGFVFVTRGLLELCRWDRDEVAFVLGHEMGHVVKRHSLERIMANSLVSAVVRRLPVPGGLLRLPLSQVLATLLSQGYSRDDELEADRIGVQLAHSAGYDPAGAARLLARLGVFAASSPGVLSYFSSHPPLEVRIQQVNQYVRTGQ